MTRRKKIVLALAVVAGLGLALPILLIPTTACACMGRSEMFGRVFEVDPVAAEASQIHAAVLRKLPIGSPVTTIDEVFAPVTRDVGLSSRRTASGSIRLHMDLGSRVLGIHRRALHLELMLDGADRLAAVRTRTIRWILGREI